MDLFVWFFPCLDHLRPVWRSAFAAKPCVPETRIIRTRALRLLQVADANGNGYGGCPAERDFLLRRNHGKLVEKPAQSVGNKTADKILIDIVDDAVVLGLMV